MIERAKSDITLAQYDSELKAKYDELNVIKEKVKKVETAYLTSYDSLPGSGDKEKIKLLLKMVKDNNSQLTLEKVKKDLENLAEHVNLEPSQTASLEEIKKAIQKPQDYESDDDQTVELSLLDLRNALGNPDSTLVPDNKLKVEEWKNILKKAGSNTIKTADNIADLIKSTGKFETDAATDGSKWSKFKDHLKNHAYGTARVNKDNETEQWNEFIQKDPKVIIGAILYFTKYENASDTEKAAVRARMEAKNGDATADETVKWQTTENATDFQKDVVTFLYREVTGSSKLIKKTKETPIPEGPGDQTGDKGKEKPPFWKSPWGITLWIVLAVVAIGAICAVIWWDNLMAWWKGEEGEGSEVSDTSE